MGFEPTRAEHIGLAVQPALTTRPPRLSCGEKNPVWQQLK